MPHIIVKLYPGRSDEMKKDFANQVAELAKDVLGAGVEHTSVAFYEVDKEDWQETVVEAEIKPNMDKLYKDSIYIKE